MTTFDSHYSSRNGHSAASTRPVRVACVYTNGHRDDLGLASMAGVRFYRMAEALARRGHEVDLVVNVQSPPEFRVPRLRQVPFNQVRWDDYDVVKTFFHRGFEALVEEGGADHPFIVSKLGSIVGREQSEGVYFFGAVREQLFQTQQEIARRSRVATVLTSRSAALWWKEHGHSTPLHMVPTGVDAEISPPRGNPYLALGIDQPVALFAGNIYSRRQQPEVNMLWQQRLNYLGRELRRHGITLVAMGTGETDYLDRGAVLHLGPIDVEEIWDWQRFAKVGIVLAQGPVQDNESSKIYYYLRTGLPVVCERSVPNSWLISETGLGALVDYGDNNAFVEAARALVTHPPCNTGVEEYLVKNHSWDVRAALYDSVFEKAAAEAGGRKKWV